MRKPTITIAVAAGGVVATAAFAIPAAGASSKPHGPSGDLRGTWQVTTDPMPGAPGDQPFQSLIAFGQAHEVVEATSRSANPPGVTSAFEMTAGLGSWVKTGGSSYRFVMQKYRFDATGAYIGKTVISEDVVVTGPQSYTGRSLTKVFGLVGTQPTAQFSSTSKATRLRP